MRDSDRWTHYTDQCVACGVAITRRRPNRRGAAEELATRYGVSKQIIHRIVYGYASERRRAEM